VREGRSTRSTKGRGGGALKIKRGTVLGKGIEKPYTPGRIEASWLGKSSIKPDKMEEEKTWVSKGLKFTGERGGLTLGFDLGKESWVWVPPQQKGTREIVSCACCKV